MALTFKHLLILFFFISHLWLGDGKNGKHEKKHKAEHKNRGWWKIKTVRGVEKVKGEDFQSTGSGRDGIYQDYSEEYDDNGDLHTSNLSRIPRVYPCKFFLPGENFYRFNTKNWHFRQMLREKVAFFFLQI